MSQTLKPALFMMVPRQHAACHEAGLPGDDRIEYEVGMICLFRQAQGAYDLAYLMFEVYRRGSAVNGNKGWTLQEPKAGKPLDMVFPSLDLRTITEVKLTRLLEDCGF